MTAAMTAGAASRTLVDWQAIDWQEAHHNVRRLQARIVQATNRVLQGTFERLELLEGKLSRAVLRGRDGGNAVLLPGAGGKGA